MAPKEMKAYMTAQMDAILEAYESADTATPIDDFAVSWIEVNAQTFRESYRIDRG